ncbi:hypothetical protein [Nonomuraea angiospora]
MSGTTYRLGDRVRVTYEGIIDKVDESDPHRFGFRVGQHGADYFRTDDGAIRHELVTDADWPPAPGDVWRDRNGARWMAITLAPCECGDDCEDGDVGLTSEFGARYPGNLQLLRAVRYYGPFRLEVPGRLRVEREGKR